MSHGKGFYDLAPCHNVIAKDIINRKFLYPTGKTVVQEFADDGAGSAVANSEKDHNSTGGIGGAVQLSEARSATKDSVVVVEEVVKDDEPCEGNHSCIISYQLF